MELEYLVRMPTPIGTIGILFENNGKDLFTLLEASEEDKRAFQLLGLDLGTLALAEKDIFERLEGIVINPASQVEFYDFRNERVETHDSTPDLANLTADVYSSLASSFASIATVREELRDYEAKAQELEDEGKDTARRTKKGNYLVYVGLGVGIALTIAGSIFHPSTSWYTSSAAAILMLSAILYDRRVSARVKASNEQRNSRINQYINELRQQREAYQNAITNLMTLKKTLLDTGWFPVGYGR